MVITLYINDFNKSEKHYIINGCSVCVFTAQGRLDAAVVSVLLFSTCLCYFSPNYIRKQFSISPTTNLPKVINKTSAPITFADDTSNLFAHSNSHIFWNFK